MKDIVKYENLVRAFCKMYGLPISIFHGIYFAERLQVLDRLYGCIDKFNSFQEDLERFNSPDEYFAYVADRQTAICNDITSKPAFNKLVIDPKSVSKLDRDGTFLSTDVIKKMNLLRGNPDLYSACNNGKTFISIDMQKANFSSLRCFSSSIFDSKISWEHYVSEFTDLKHLINGRYFRQSIFGTCAPTAIQNLTKYIMVNAMHNVSNASSKWGSALYGMQGSDELLYEIDADISEKDKCDAEIEELRSLLSGFVASDYFVYKCFKLEAISNTKCFIKHYHTGDISYKCADPSTLIQLIRYHDGEQITPVDLTFVSEGRLAQYIEPISNPWAKGNAI